MADYFKRLYAMDSAKSSGRDTSSSKPPKDSAVSDEDKDTSGKIYSMRAQQGKSNNQSDADQKSRATAEKKRRTAELAAEASSSMNSAKESGTEESASKENKHSSMQTEEKSETNETMENIQMKNLGPEENRNNETRSTDTASGRIPSRPLKASREAALNTKKTETPKESQPSRESKAPKGTPQDSPMEKSGEKSDRTGTDGSADPGVSPQVSEKSEHAVQSDQQKQTDQWNKSGQPVQSKKPDQTKQPSKSSESSKPGETGKSSESSEPSETGKSSETGRPVRSEERTPPLLRPKAPPLHSDASKQTQQGGEKLGSNVSEEPKTEEAPSSGAGEPKSQPPHPNQTPKKRVQMKKKINGVDDIQKNRRRRRTIMVITAVTVIIALSAAYYVYQVQQQQAAAAAAAQASQVYQVTREIYQEEVDISGNVWAYETRQPYFRLSGTVESVYAEEGDTVEAGELIAELDDMEIQYELAQLDYQIEQNELEGSLRQLELNRMQRNILENRLEKTKLFAPISGTLTELNIEAGDMVSAGTSSPAAKIVNASTLKASVEVDEYDINRVKVGQRARLTFDALGDETEVEASVDSIPLEGNVTSEGIAVKHIDLVIEDAPEGISPSYSFSGVILAGGEQEILTVPENAVIEQPDGTKVLMVRRNGESVTQVRVTTKQLNDGSIQILSGNVSAGDTVVVPTSDTAGISMPGGSAPFPGMSGGGRR